MQLALPIAGNRFDGIRLPPFLPPFNKRAQRLFTLFWVVAFALALAGPLAGFYLRYTEAANNSQLLLGSRAGFAVSPRDATMIRFTVGPQAQRAGVMPGDHIIAIYGLPLPAKMPVDEQILAVHANDPAYIALGNLVYGTDNSDVPITVRDPNGRARARHHRHNRRAARRSMPARAPSGFPPKWLGFIDLMHVLAYPFLLWAAWLLHHRNSRDAVSSILSLAVLLSDGRSSSRPRFSFSTSALRAGSMSRSTILANVLLLTGILLFPARAICRGGELG